MKALGRLLTAMVTPMTADRAVDYGRAEELAHRLLAQGSDGLVVAGTTGESPTLTDEEKLQLFRVVKLAAGPTPVIAGTGSNDTAHSVHLTRAAEDTGVDGILLVGPYYNKPAQEGYFQHFRTVAAATSLPIVLYNIPGRTGSNITAETTLRLAEAVTNIVGIKEGSGDLEQMAKICAGAPEEFTVWSGDDAVTLPLLAVGGFGVISVVSHVAGPRMAEMMAAFSAGDTARAAKLHQELLPLIKALFQASGNPPCVKRALQVCGFDCGGLRLPLVEASEADTQVIIAQCQRLGLAG